MKGKDERDERGFVLAIGLIVLAAMAVLGVAALNSALFQDDVANSVRENQETYYAATAGLSHALEEMLQVYPGTSRTLEDNDPFFIGSIDVSTGTTEASSAGCDATDYDCICRSQGVGRCFSCYVELRMLRCGHARHSSVDKYVTLYYRVTATASSAHGNTRSVSVEVASTYQGYCP